MSQDKHVKTENQKTASQLCDQILGRIDEEEIKPCPKWQFVCKDSLVWVLWAFSVALGAISVAVMWYVVDHARYSLYEATHEKSFSFFVEVLPYIWIVSFVLMAVFAYSNLRKTRKGYRFPIWQLLGSSLIFAILGGLLLHLAGVGGLIDTSFGRGMDTYPSMEKKEMKLWQMPKEGRLVGSFATRTKESMIYRVTDANDEDWEVVVNELNKTDLQLLEMERSVRLLGTTTDFVNKKFHACGVFPWMYNGKEVKDKLIDERERFVEKMHEHMEKSKNLEKANSYEKEVYGRTFMEGLCAEIAVVRRLAQ